MQCQVAVSTVAKTVLVIGPGARLSHETWERVLLHKTILCHQSSPMILMVVGNLTLTVALNTWQHTLIQTDSGLEPMYSVQVGTSIEH